MPAPMIMIFFGATVAVMIVNRASETPATAIVLCLRKVRRFIRIIGTSYLKLRTESTGQTSAISSKFHKSCGFAAAHGGKSPAYRDVDIIELEASPPNLLRRSLSMTSCLIEPVSRRLTAVCCGKAALVHLVISRFRHYFLRRS